jgi:hypothetical protein
VITGEENFLHRTLSSVGVPALHILRAQNGLEYRFYELTGDLPEALHFRHFDRSEPEKIQVRERIRLKGSIPSPASATATSAGSTPGRIRLKEDASQKGTPVKVKPAAGKIKLKKNGKKADQPNEGIGETSTPLAASVERPLRIKQKLGRGQVKVCKI